MNDMMHENLYKKFSEAINSADMLENENIEWWNCAGCGHWLRAIILDGRWWIIEENGSGSGKWEMSVPNLRPDWVNYECGCFGKERIELMDKNCENCYYSGYNRCLRSPTGQRLDQRHIKRVNGCNEFDRCKFHKKVDL